jgi:uncharacterized protein YwqG
MKMDELRVALDTAGLDRLIPYLSQVTLPAIRIEANLLADDDLPLGASKLGGRPDLLPTVEWPSFNGNSLTFLAQFNLAEMRQYDVEAVLPPTGLLSFFYDFVSGPYGIDPHDCGGWRAVYFDDLTSLSRRPWPSSRSSVYHLPTSEPWFSTMTTMTDEPDWIVGSTTMDDERRKLSQLVESVVLSEAGISPSHDDVFETLGTRHQLLGYPRIGLRVRMPVDCELAANRGSSNILSVAAVRTGEQLPEIDEQQAYRQWRLLFQLGNISSLRWPEDNDEDSPYWELDLWARGGLMYFWIERDRLAKHDFSNVWLVGGAQL